MVKTNKELSKYDYRLHQNILTAAHTLFQIELDHFFSFKIDMVKLFMQAQNVRLGFVPTLVYEYTSNLTDALF